MKRILYWFLTLACLCCSLASFYLVIFEIGIWRGFMYSLFALGIFMVMETLDEL